MCCFYAGWPNTVLWRIFQLFLPSWRGYISCVKTAQGQKQEENNPKRSLSCVIKIDHFQLRDSSCTCFPVWEGGWRHVHAIRMHLRGNQDFTCMCTYNVTPGQGLHGWHLNKRESVFCRGLIALDKLLDNSSCVLLKETCLNKFGLQVQDTYKFKKLLEVLPT